MSRGVGPLLYRDRTGRNPPLLRWFAAGPKRVGRTPRSVFLRSGFGPLKPCRRTGPDQETGSRFAGMIERDSDRGKWVCRVCPNAITPTNNYDGLCRSCWETLVLEEDGEVEHLV